MLLIGGRTARAGPVMIAAVDADDNYDYNDGEDYNYEEYFQDEQQDSEEPRPRLPDQVFFDDQALSNCWLSALYDFKVANPSFFKQAPAERSKRFQYTSAPLWYGPLPEVAEIVSTDPTGATTNKEQEPTLTYPPQTRRGKNKKRKRAKQNGNRTDSFAWKRPRIDSRDSSPRYTPSSPPDLQDESMLATVNQSVLQTTYDAQESDPELPDESAPDDDQPASPPPALVDGDALDPTSIIGDTSHRRPIMFPDPPDVTDLDERDVPDLDKADEQELLNAALWAWFTAGYNTALYNIARQRP
ncbi:hypothetical protein OIV83_002265 [Microbotryomycetes sp. JL201]|nr:hypothetical protein OIV83_002265 [Microbotryomycetes sp. JL201]